MSSSDQAENEKPIVVDTSGTTITNGFRVDYSNWMKGKRLLISSNSESWVKKNSPSNKFVDFIEYAEVFQMYSHVLFHFKELKATDLEENNSKDLFIHVDSLDHGILWFM